MNSQSFTLAERLIPSTYLQQAASSKRARENLIRALIEQVSYCNNNNCSRLTHCSGRVFLCTLFSHSLDLSSKYPRYFPKCYCFVAYLVNGSIVRALKVDGSMSTGRRTLFSFKIATNLNERSPTAVCSSVNTSPTSSSFAVFSSQLWHQQMRTSLPLHQFCLQRRA